MFVPSANYDAAHAATPNNPTRSRGVQPGHNDGAHSRPPRKPRNWRRRVALALAAVVLAIGAIFILRATTDRYEGSEPTPCIDIYGEDICELRESTESP